MPRFWYPSAIVAATSVLVSLAISLPPDVASVSQREQVASPRATLAVAKHAVSTAENLDDDMRLFEQSQLLANQAVEAFQSARKNPEASLFYTRRERDLWQAALTSLSAIPEASDVYSSAAEKQGQYQQLLATAEDKISEVDSAFLTEIVETTGARPGSVRVTLCQIDNPAANLYSGPLKLLNPAHRDVTARTQVKSQISAEQCRHYRGDELLASPASLIKLPIAIALVQKAEAEGIDLNQKIKIDPGNFTENAEGAELKVGEAYPLKEIMAHMIDRSDNIATNQLIDFIGRDRLAPILEEMGYVDTYAGHKLAGNRVMPKDMGDRRNQTTTNDITAMMVRAYGLQAPGGQEVLEALAAQMDGEFGREALQNSKAEWLGEKTGQNRQVIGSTLAMQVGIERYALTVAIDHSGNIEAVREIISGVADYLADGKSLMVRQSVPSSDDVSVAQLD